MAEEMEGEQRYEAAVGGRAVMAEHRWRCGHNWPSVDYGSNRVHITNVSQFDTFF